MKNLFLKSMILLCLTNISCGKSSKGLRINLTDNIELHFKEIEADNFKLVSNDYYTEYYLEDSINNEAVFAYLYRDKDRLNNYRDFNIIRAYQEGKNKDNKVLIFPLRNSYSKDVISEEYLSIFDNIRSPDSLYRIEYSYSEIDTNMYIHFNFIFYKDEINIVETIGFIDKYRNFRIYRK